MANTLITQSTPFDLRQKLMMKYGQMESERMLWRPLWRQLQEYILPDNGVGLSGQQNEQEQISGEKTHASIIDGSATRYIDIFAAGMQSGLTSPSRPWFRLGLQNADLAAFHPVKVWLEEVEARMRAVFDASNFYASLHHIYRELPVFGTAAQIMLEDYDTAIRCRPFTTGEFWMSMDSSLRVDTIYRQLWMTACQLVEQFGKSECSLAVQNAYENNNVKSRFQVIHAIEPNSDRTDVYDLSQKAWRSVYFELGGDSTKILRIQGFDEFPCQCPRWNIIGSKVYGRSRGMDALADVKMLQRFCEAQLVNYDKAMEPPVVAPPALKKEQINTIPGGVTYSDDMSANTGLRRFYEVPDMLDSGEKKIQNIKGDLREWFFTDLFLMLANQPTRSGVTATEISERHEEKLLVLGPVLERVHGELLDPSISRAFSILAKMGMLPPPPPIKELRGQKIKVEYVSSLAIAAKMTQLTSMDQLMGRVGALAQINPDALDNIDFDAYVRTYADDAAVPAKMINSLEKVEALRAARRKMQQEQAQAAQIPAMAAAAKDASQADLSGNTVLSRTMGRVIPQQVPEAS